MEDKTLFEAMQAFHNIAQAVAFSTGEVALFHALLHSWNVARRPAVIEQWVNTTCANTGLEAKHSFPRARNGLVQKGVIFFEKKGNRGVPRYSINALFESSNPFLLPNKGSKCGGKHGSKGGVNTVVKADSYKRERKEHGEGKEELAPASRKFLEEDETEPTPQHSSNQYPTLEKVLSFAKSQALIIQPDCAEMFYNEMEASGWVNKHGQAVRSWQASLRAYASRWNQFTQRASTQKSTPSHHKTEYVKSL